MTKTLACTCATTPHKRGCPLFPKRCPKCKVGERELGRVCPYGSEIHGDTSECSCCDGCMGDCADSV